MHTNRTFAFCPWPGWARLLPALAFTAATRLAQGPASGSRT